MSESGFQAADTLSASKLRSLMFTTGFTEISQVWHCMSKLRGLPGLAGLKEVH